MKTVGENEEFIEDIFGAVEFEFTEHFGQKWTPEVYEMFQSALATTRAVAIALDARSAEAASLSYAGRRVRRLTNRMNK